MTRTAASARFPFWLEWKWTACTRRPYLRALKIRIFSYASILSHGPRPAPAQGIAERTALNAVSILQLRDKAISLIPVGLAP